MVLSRWTRWACLAAALCLAVSAEEAATLDDEVMNEEIDLEEEMEEETEEDAVAEDPLLPTGEVLARLLHS